jgi:hypothetical protein
MYHQVGMQMTRALASGRLVGVGVTTLLSLGVGGFLASSLFAQEEAHGIGEFAESATWRVPAGLTHIIVELWGAGGGGGAGASVVVGGTQSAGGPGGGGVSGSYVSGSYVKVAVAVHRVAGTRGAALEAPAAAASPILLVSCVPGLPEDAAMTEECLSRW